MLLDCNRIAVDAIAEAHKKIIFDSNLITSLVIVSITLTPVAFCVLLLKTTSDTIECGLIVRFPVASAIGIVDEFEVKEAPYGHPRLHLFLC